MLVLFVGEELGVDIRLGAGDGEAPFVVCVVLLCFACAGSALSLAWWRCVIQTATPPAAASTTRAMSTGIKAFLCLPGSAGAEYWAPLISSRCLTAVMSDLAGDVSLVPRCGLYRSRKGSCPATSPEVLSFPALAACAA